MKKNTSLFIAFGAILGVLVVFYVMSINRVDLSPTNNGQLGTNGGGISPAPSLTREEVPSNVKVPELNDEASPDVAQPTVVSPAAPGVESRYRSFNISADRNKFNPSTIIVNTGDTVHINFTAVDKTYDFTIPDYGLKQTATGGQTKVVEFQALNDGKYTFYCERCGGLDSNVIGYIIVIDKS